MASEIVLPQWGMEMQDGTIVKWLKKEGDTVEEGEPIVEIETAKLQTELESTASGILARIVAQEGEIVPIRGLLAVISAPGEEVPMPATVATSAATASATPAAKTTEIPASPPAHRGEPDHVQVVPAARRLAQQHGIDVSTVQGSGPRGRVLIEDVEKATQAPAAPSTASANGVRVQIVPAARRLAGEKGIDLGQVRGSGPGGRILLQDVEQAISGVGSLSAAGKQGIIEFTGIRGTIATRMLQSLQTMAQLTITTEANVTEAMTLRQGLSRHQTDGNISPLHLVIKATARALKEYPRLNALQLDDKVRTIAQINIGVAVALDEGLITPVIKDADTKTLAQLAQQGRELAAKTRGGIAKPEDVTGGTFTITNLGAYEIDAFTPIINPPQVGILGLGRVVEKPVIVGGQVAKGAMMYLSLTFDHRIVDGAPAAEFLQKVKGYLEDPWWMVS
jgi:pyruvate dehydrogenase E2 component (dihydrolipoamide acetyltransferase)